MLTLAIDTSGTTLSAALLEDLTTRAEFFLNTGDNHSQHLLPAIKRIYSLAGAAIPDTDLFVCTEGPGSFTGLRIGVGTVKGLALATDKPVLGLSTLEVLAANMGPDSGRIYPLLDAKRGQVYAGAYRMKGGIVPEQIAEELLADVTSWISSIKEEGKIVFLGSGALKYADVIKAARPDSFVAAAHFSYIRASVAGCLAVTKFLDGCRTDVLSFAPRYLRLSEAERKLSPGDTPEDKKVDKP